jgi:hypothetical protein
MSEVVKKRYSDLTPDELRAYNAEAVRRSKERRKQGIFLRTKRTKAEGEQLKRQIMEVPEADHPQSIRHVFYRMTDPRLPEPVEKSLHGYNQVQSRMVAMRRDGTLPYGWLVDASRSGIFVNTFTSPRNFITSLAWQYRANPWDASDWHCEVWVESRSIAGIVQELCDDYAVSLYPCGGFSSLTLAFEASPTLNEAAAEGKRLKVLYIGDWDQAGVLIDRAVENELRQHLDAEAEAVLSFDRIAITEAQIADYDLPTKPRKEGDTRSLDVRATVEAEAMPARIMRELLTAKLDELLPEGALAEALEESDRQRAALERIARRMKGVK